MGSKSRARRVDARLRPEASRPGFAASAALRLSVLLSFLAARQGQRAGARRGADAEAANARSSPRALLVLAMAFVLLGCAPAEPEPAKPPKVPVCPPPIEAEYQAAVVGTIGKYHLVESRFPVARLGDVLAIFKPDLLLLAVRVDAFREGHLEDASFEMTYVNALAHQHGVVVEPIDWFREQDLAAPPAAVEPWDESEIARREGAILTEPRLYTFEQANGKDLGQRIFLAGLAEARHRSGDALVSRRHAQMAQLAASAVERHGRPKRVLAYVDVLDRPSLEALLHGVGYATPEPAAIVQNAKDEIIGDIPGDVLAEWQSQQARAHANTEAAKTPPEKTFWAEREHILRLVNEKHAQCCVTQSAVNAEH